MLTRIHEISGVYWDGGVSPILARALPILNLVSFIRRNEVGPARFNQISLRYAEFLWTACVFWDSARPRGAFTVIC